MADLKTNKTLYLHSEEVNQLINRPPKGFILYGNTGIILLIFVLIVSTLFVDLPTIAIIPVTFVQPLQQHIKTPSKENYVFRGVTTLYNVKTGQRSFVTIELKESGQSLTFPAVVLTVEKDLKGSGQILLIEVTNDMNISGRKKLADRSALLLHGVAKVIIGKDNIFHILFNPIIKRTIH